VAPAPNLATLPVAPAKGLAVETTITLRRAAAAEAHKAWKVKQADPAHNPVPRHAVRAAPVDVRTITQLPERGDAELLGLKRARPAHSRVAQYTAPAVSRTATLVAYRTQHPVGGLPRRQLKTGRPTIKTLEISLIKRERKPKRR
jgi:hypothetical protein